MQEHTTDTTELVNVPLTGADKVAYAFYATAATAALVGQVWAGVTHIPWPEEGFPIWLQIAVVTPAVAVIELGGVATAALADLRRRKGEQAYAYRAMSLFAALVALVFNVVGHWRPEERFLAFGFGGLSAFAYVLWLIHSSARRRDALRRVGQMANTGPVYGIVQWAREPKVTWLARSLALEHGYGLYESLRQAREQIRTTARRVAIAGTVAEFIRSEQQDERLAKIAETTYDPDKLAAMLEERVNYETVTARLTRAIAPAPDAHQEQERSDLRAAVWVVEDAGHAPEVESGGGVPLRGQNDRWSEAIGELTAAEYLPYDRSTDEPDVVVVEDEYEEERQRQAEFAGAQRAQAPASRSGAAAGGARVPATQAARSAAPEARPTAKSAVRSTGASATRSAAASATRSTGSSATRSAGSTAQKAAEPAVRPADQEIQETHETQADRAAAVEVKRPAKSASKPATRPAAKQATKSAAARTAAQPAARSNAQPAESNVQPADQSPAQRSDRAGSRIASQATDRPTLSEAGPLAQPATRPAPARADESAAQSATWPVPQRAAEPTPSPAVVVTSSATTPVPARLSPAPTRSVEPEEPVVVARKVTSRTRPATTGTGSASAGAKERDSEKKKMRAWALLSDWPADRKRDASTLASAIAASESYAEQLIKLYDEENGNRPLVGTQHQQG